MVVIVKPSAEHYFPEVLFILPGLKFEKVSEMVFFDIVTEELNVNSDRCVTRELPGVVLYEAFVCDCR